jgi:hypothetical protein
MMPVVATMKPLIIAPILFFTLMLGPVGYVAYLIVQSGQAFLRGRATG